MIVVSLTELLPADIRQKLDTVAKNYGCTADEAAIVALRDYLAITLGEPKAKSYCVPTVESEIRRIAHSAVDLTVLKFPKFADETLRGHHSPTESKILDIVEEATTPLRIKDVIRIAAETGRGTLGYNTVASVLSDVAGSGEIRRVKQGYYAALGYVA